MVDSGTTSERWLGLSLPRREDAHLLKGQGRFVDDHDELGPLHMAVLRSPYAHARILNIEFGEAPENAGVVGILLGEQVRQRSNPLSVLRPLPEVTSLPFFALAGDKVLFEGHPIMSVVAPTRAMAEDFLDQVVVSYELLPHVTNTDMALAPGAVCLWPEVSSNLVGVTMRERGEVERAISEGHTVTSGRFTVPRVIGLPMETRGLIATWNSATTSLSVVSSTQTPHLLRQQLAEALAMTEANIRVVAHDVGGGFGVKLGMYPEDVLACLHAIELGKTVIWIEDRLEHFRSSTHAREAVHEAKVVLDKEGGITTLCDSYVVDMGAYNSSFGPPMLSSLMFFGPYRVTTGRVERKIAVTNKPPVGAYRGYGQPESNFVREVLLDRAARSLGLDPLEIRRRNLLRSDELPFESVSGALYDSGDYPRCLETAARTVEYDELRSKQAAWWSQGRYVGVGLSMFLEMTGYPGSASLGRAAFGAYESITLRANRSGGLDVYSGLSSFGQGSETAVIQLCASALDISPEDVVVHFGDTAGTPYNVGGFASRTTIAVAGAVLAASAEIKEKALRIAGALLSVEVHDLELIDGSVRVIGDPKIALGFDQIANEALLARRLPSGMTPGLESTVYFDPPASTFGNGAAAAVVEVDIETGEFRIDRFVLAHDCGRQINPMLVEGQLLGGLTQGLGCALLEDLKHDPESGVLLNGTLVDYLVPSAADVPKFEVVAVDVPSPVTPLGVRGVGEAGTIPVAAAIANAICDALSPLHVELNALPITAERVWQAINNRNIGCAAEGSH
jgi:carbon-monoxide dehydrogenase large subunit